MNLTGLAQYFLALGLDFGCLRALVLLGGTEGVEMADSLTLVLLVISLDAAAFLALVLLLVGVKGVETSESLGESGGVLLFGPAGLDSEMARLLGVAFVARDCLGALAFGTNGDRIGLFTAGFFGTGARRVGNGDFAILGSSLLRVTQSFRQIISTHLSSSMSSSSFSGDEEISLDSLSSTMSSIWSSSLSLRFSMKWCKPC